MWEEVVVKDKFCPFPLVIPCLVRGKLLADIHDTPLEAVAFALFKVLHHEGEDILVGRNSIHDLVIADKPE